jgi:regulator of RNase E activity RraB
MADQLPEQLAAAMQQVTLARIAVDQFRQGAYECSESLRVSGLDHGDSIVEGCCDYLSIMIRLNMQFLND